MYKQPKIRLVHNRAKKLNKDGTAPVLIEVYDPNTRNKKYIHTGIKVTPEQWDDAGKKVINHIQATYYNWQLLKQVQDLYKTIQNKIDQNGKFQISDLEPETKKQQKFWQYFDRYLENHTGSKSRKQYIARTIKILKEFDPDLTFERFTLEKITEFDAFLHKKHYHINTIAHFHKAIKAFLNQMIKQEVISKNPYDKFKIRKEKTERTFLSDTELEAVEKVDLQNDSKELVQTLDMFLFSCYTGLRFSDIQKLNSQNIVLSKDGVYLYVKQQKTKELVTMPLHLLFDGKPVQILRKYYKAGKQRIFPKMTNQAVNRLLKVIGYIAGIDKTLTFHVARHTFGTLIAMHTKDPYLVKQLMGHSDIETSMTYIHLSNKLIEEKLKKIDW